MSHRPHSPRDHHSPAARLSLSEGGLALRNGITLAGSLALTWAIALIVTFKLPRYLAPELFGHYRFGDQFAMSMAVFLGLGIDTYVSREAATRPDHVSDFFGGVLLARGMLLLPLGVASWVLLRDQVDGRRVTAVVFGAAYLFVSVNQTLQQTLQAASRVRGLAVANVLAKIVWGGGIVAAVIMKAPLWVLAAPLIIAEAFKAIVLYGAAKRAVRLRFRIDVRETLAALRIAFPFYIGNVAVTLGSSIDVVMLGKLHQATSSEVGWYAAARQIAQLTALLSPIISGVLLPMMSRARTHNEDEFYAILRKSISATLAISIPITLLVGLGAEQWIHLALGNTYLPAASSLRWLAPTFVLSYVNVLLWLALMILGRSWTLTIISLVGLAVLPAFITIAVSMDTATTLGSMGTRVAAALSARELLVAVTFVACLRTQLADRALVVVAAKSIATCLLIVGLDRLLSTVVSPFVRLGIDAVCHVAVLLAARVIRFADVAGVVALLRERAPRS